MLKLYLLRHGKATKSTDEKADFERHLNKEGTAQVNQTGYILKSEQLKLDQIIASEAVRTSETAEIINHFIGLPTIKYDKGFYMTTYDEVWERFCLYAKGERVMYVGHNNAISDLASYLTGRNIGMSTGHLIEIQFDTDAWVLVSRGSGKVVREIVPDVHCF
jgi:phosphohistidine phosphatase